MSRTSTPAPTDRSMWRRLLMRAHPDQGGDKDLFVWARELEERITAAGGISADPCGDCCQLRQPQPQQSSDSPGPTQPPPPEHPERPDRIDFDPDIDHEVLVERAVTMASEVVEPYSRLLEMLKGCASAPGHRGAERLGASYKQLALIAHRAGMPKVERVDWYEVAARAPLSQRHAGYIIESLMKVRAA